MCCAVVVCIEGLLDVIYGASPKSRFYAVDKVVTPILGVCLVVLSALIFVRRSWAFYGLISCLAIQVISNLLTARLEAESALRGLERENLFRVWSIFLIVLVISNVVPIILLLWLHPIFVTE